MTKSKSINATQADVLQKLAEGWELRWVHYFRAKVALAPHRLSRYTITKDEHSDPREAGGF